MSDGIGLLLDLQRRVTARCDPERPAEFESRFAVGTDGNLLHVELYGDPCSEEYKELLSTVAGRRVAVCLASLQLRGPDEGANGTRNWDLSPLLDSASSLPQLRTFSVEQTKPGDHNRSIIGKGYDEEGQLTELLAKSPQLTNLTSPSTPGPSFFEVGERPLRHLNFDAGYDHQNFILNLSRSSCFPQLYVLEYGEFSEIERYRDQPCNECTPHEHFEELFHSGAFAGVEAFVLRNPDLTIEQIAHLKRLRPQMQFKEIRWSSGYVR